MANGIWEKLINIFNIPLRIRSSEDGKAIYFADAKEENICEEKDYYSMGALGPYTADLQHKFKLQYGNWRIFEVRDKDQFFFDNVNIYPDDDNTLSLGMPNNRWKDVHAVEMTAEKMNLMNLETPPPGTQTVNLVLDTATGKIYRKN